MPSRHAIILENLRSAYNVGTIIRTAEGLGYDVITSGFTPPATHPKVAKTALGAEQLVSCQHIDHVSDAITYARTHYQTLIAAEVADKAIDLASFVETHRTAAPVHRSVAIVVGNELTGISMGTRTAVDTIVQIPMHGTKSSLNVAVAAGIMMYAIGAYA